MQTFDLIIVGGGVMGSAIAAHLLTADSNLNIFVIERDSTTSICHFCEGRNPLLENIWIPVFTEPALMKVRE